MKGELRILKAITFLMVLFFMTDISSARSRNTPDLPENDSVSAFNNNFFPEKKFIHRIGVDIRPEYIIPAHSFLKGENENMKPIRKSFSSHFKYSFQPHQNTDVAKIFGNAYQGIGLAYYNLDEKKYLGNPIAFYLFQGAHLAKLDSRISFNYEWNFGLSAGWVPHDYETNTYNTVIGSKVNAYINANVYLNWMLSSKLDLTTGITFTHFSNGNTKIPNAGLNSTGLNAGLVYSFNRKNRLLPEKSFLTHMPEFPRHISYDLLFFGSWRRKGVLVGDDNILSPHTYTVLGFNFAPMYNIGYKFRTGLSLDGYYDGSANVYAPTHIAGTVPQFLQPPFKEQIALGLSGRAEYVMPYFSVNLGFGANFIQRGNDLKTFYQVLALKINVTRSSFIHIGYSLQNFDTPNFLMLGIGFRFNNKYPSLRH